MNSTKRMHVLIKLGDVDQFGPAKTRRVIQRLSEDSVDFEWLLEYDSSDLVEVGMTEQQASDFIGRRLSEAELDEIARLAEAGVGAVLFTDADIPKRLNAPSLSPWYFYFGDMDILSTDTIGFSGSRDASSEALIVTEAVATAAVSAGLSIVSGGARGVDHAAHAAAIDAGGTTVVVIPQGISLRMPSINVDPSQVLVLSEFLPAHDWGSFRAMQRNKSIINLSDNLVVPQAGLKGGTANAADYALKKERNLWVADLGDGYPGNQLLLKRGARPLPWIDDVPDLETMLKPRAAKPAQQTLF